MILELLQVTASTLLHDCSHLRKFRGMYGAAWTIKLVMGTIIDMKTNKIKGRCFTSVRAQGKLADGLRDFTLFIANIKAGEVMVLIGDGPEQDIHHETEKYAQIESTEDRVSLLEGAVSQSKRLNESDKRHSQEGLLNAHGPDWKREEVTMQFNGMVPLRR